MTNEEIQEIVARADDEYDRLKDRVHEQYDEIERLQDLCNKYEKEHKKTYEIWKKDIYLYNSLVDRIDKAIEYIEQYTKDTNFVNGYELLDILKGVDKE